MRRATHLVLAVGLLVGAAACDEDIVNRAEPTPDHQSTDDGGQTGGSGAGGGQTGDGQTGGSGSGTAGDGQTGGGQTGGGGEPNGPLLLIVDSSGSMNEPGPDGQPLLDDAKQALHELVAALPDDQAVGLRVYGHRHTTQARACRDTELIHPVGPMDRPALTSIIDGLGGR